MLVLERRLAQQRVQVGVRPQRVRARHRVAARRGEQIAELSKSPLNRRALRLSLAVSVVPEVALLAIAVGVGARRLQCGAVL